MSAIASDTSSRTSVIKLKIAVTPKITMIYKMLSLGKLHEVPFDLFAIWGKGLGRARPILTALATVGIGEAPPLR